MTPYQELQANGRPRRPGPRRVFAPDVARQRQLERNRRTMAARQRADAVLRARHRDEWQAIVDLERPQIDVERGPLPGDEGVR